MKLAVLVLWLVAGTYCAWFGMLLADIEVLKSAASPIGVDPTGGGSVAIVDGVEFSNLTDALIYRKEKDAAAKFPWLTWPVSNSRLLAIGCMGFGTLGGVVSLLLRRPVLASPGPYLIPLLGALVAIPLWLFYLLIEKGGPDAALFACFTGGCFQRNTLEWLRTLGPGPTEKADTDAP